MPSAVLPSQHVQDSLCWQDLRCHWQLRMVPQPTGMPYSAASAALAWSRLGLASAAHLQHFSFFSLQWDCCSDQFCFNSHTFLVQIAIVLSLLHEAMGADDVVSAALTWPHWHLASADLLPQMKLLSTPNVTTAVASCLKHPNLLQLCPWLAGIQPLQHSCSRRSFCSLPMWQSLLHCMTEQASAAAAVAAAPTVLAWSPWDLAFANLLQQSACPMSS